MGEVGEGLQRLGHQREVPVGALIWVLWEREARDKGWRNEVYLSALSPYESGYSKERM